MRLDSKQGKSQRGDTSDKIFQICLADESRGEPVYGTEDVSVCSHGNQQQLGIQLWATLVTTSITSPHYTHVCRHTHRHTEGHCCHDNCGGEGERGGEKKKHHWQVNIWGKSSLLVSHFPCSTLSFSLGCIWLLRDDSGTLRRAEDFFSTFPSNKIKVFATKHACFTLSVKTPACFYLRIQPQVKVHSPWDLSICKSKHCAVVPVSTSRDTFPPKYSHLLIVTSLISRPGYKSNKKYLNNKSVSLESRTEEAHNETLLIQCMFVRQFCEGFTVCSKRQKQLRTLLLGGKKNMRGCKRIKKMCLRVNLIGSAGIWKTGGLWNHFYLAYRQNKWNIVK